MLKITCLKVFSLTLRDFNLPAGEAVAVTGVSGAGKSLVLRALADLIPSEGEVYIEGQLREKMSGPEWRRLVTYVAATPGWWEMRAEDHFKDLGLAIELAEELLLPPDIISSPVAQLSTGEQQRLVLIRALIQSPKVLLLDEPTSGLDTKATARVENRLNLFLEAGGAIMFVTHDPRQAKRLAKRSLQLDNTRIRECRL